MFPHIAFDSAALAERLLNDMLKATEAFNKLKKINEDLKKQVGSESSYVSQGFNLILLRFGNLKFGYANLFYFV